MRVLVHLSDLHFGRIDETLLAPLAARIRVLAPHLVVVSGDLTQRARRKQFAHAQAFLNSLPAPRLVVPGNHDVDYDVAKDEDSLESYRAAFGPDNWAWEEPGLALIGLDNVVYLPGQKPAYTGGLRDEQFVWLQAYLDGLSPDTLVVLAMHIHLFDAEPGMHDFRRWHRAGPEQWRTR